MRDFAYNETRYTMLTQTNEERAELLLKEAQDDAVDRWEKYRQLAAMDYSQYKMEE